MNYTYFFNELMREYATIVLIFVFIMLVVSWFFIYSAVKYAIISANKELKKQSDETTLQ